MYSADTSAQSVGAAGRQGLTLLQLVRNASCLVHYSRASEPRQGSQNHYHDVMPPCQLLGQFEAASDRSFHVHLEFDDLDNRFVEATVRCAAPRGSVSIARDFFGPGPSLAMAHVYSRRDISIRQACLVNAQ